MNAADLTSLDIARLCRDEVSLQSEATLPLTGRLLTRLAAESQSEFVVDWHLGFAANQLALTAKTQLRVRCERCLQSMSIDLSTANAYGFVKDEATALEQDANSEVDLLVVSKTFNALDLIEDELLMALPFNPMHDLNLPEGAACQKNIEALRQQSDNIAFAKPSPFAGLKQLLK